MTGATGYVGGRLLGLLESQSIPVRCMVRRPENLRARVGPSTEVVAGDTLEPASLEKALEGVEVAFYLVHYMQERRDFEDLELRSA